MQMRRYELVEGKSAKFWEVGIDGSDVHLRWGRIGANGHSQIKSFASASAAQKEADKLVKSKTKKGYAEVGGSEVATPVTSAEKHDANKDGAPLPETAEAPPARAAAATAEAAPPATPGGSRAEPAALESRVHPDRLESCTWETPGEPASELFAKLKEKTKWVWETAGLLVHAPPDVEERTRPVYEILCGESEPELDLERASRLLAIADEARDYLASRFSRADRVRIALGAAGYCMLDREWNNERYFVLEKGVAGSRERSESMVAAAGLADALDAADFAAIREEATTAWETWPWIQRVWAAVVLGRDPGLALRILAESESYQESAIRLVASLRSVEDVERLLGGIEASWLYIPRELLDLLVQRQGTAAGPLLVTLGRKLREIHRVVEAMSAVETPEIAGFMGDMLEHREYRNAARDYLFQAPELAIATLATQHKQMARSVVEALVRAQPALVDELLPELEPQARAAVEQIRDAASVDVPDAEDSELPAVLREPPWTGPRKKAGKPVTLDLEPLAMAESVEWREGQKALWTGSGYGTPSAEGSRTLREVVDRWTADEPPRNVPSYQRGVDLWHFSCAEDDVALECWNRMTPGAFGWSDGDSVRQLVARLEERGMPGYVALAAKQTQSAAENLTGVRSPRLAPLYSRVLASRGKNRSHAQAWLESFPEEAAAGLIPIALGTQKKERALAGDAISYLGWKGHRDTVLRVAAKYGEAAVAPVTALLDRDPLDAVPRKMPKLPGWAKADALPRPLLPRRDKALPARAVEHVITMLAFSPLDPPYPGIEQVNEACDPESLLEFSWGLFSAWLGADGSSAGDFAMLSLGHFGGDEAARRLTPLIRKWPGEAAHARAVKGLDVLAAIGSDVALMHLHGISQKLKFKGLQAKAKEKIAQIAEARELTTDELADRLVPDLDLDERGTMLLDFGPRSFTVGFDEHLAPFVLDNGKRRKALPKPGKSDDAEKAKAATQAWKTLKKDARAIATHQITRLEQLMCSGRRVPLDVFRTFFVDHPLVIHLVQRLVWGAFMDDRLAGAFRIDGERQPTNSDDELFELPEGAEISLLHPLAMDDATKARFGELFADYEILQPFEQLGRATYAATPEELSAKALSRFDGKMAPLGKVRGLENQGWVRGAAQDAGLVWDVIKPIPGRRDLEIAVGLDPGFSVAGYDDFADTANQKLSAPVIRYPSSWQGGVGLDALDAVQMSELIRDLVLITS